MTVSKTVSETVKEAGHPDHSEKPPPVRRATREEMRAAKVPLAFRDACAHILIPLNKCRVKEYYLPWKCVDLRHSYEKCEYEEFLKRVAKMDKIKAQPGYTRSN